MAHRSLHQTTAARANSWRASLVQLPKRQVISRRFHPWPILAGAASPQARPYLLALMEFRLLPLPLAPHPLLTPRGLRPHALVQLMPPKV